MSVWGDIRKKSIGQEKRIEDKNTSDWIKEIINLEDEIHKAIRIPKSRFNIKKITSA